MNYTVIFSIDKLRILSSATKYELIRNLGLRKLKLFSARTHLDANPFQRFESRIETEQPEREWFDILNEPVGKDLHHKLRDYRISYLELAFDLPMNTKSASVKTAREISRVFKKKYRRSHEKPKTDEGYNENGPYYYSAFEESGKNAGTVIYNRLSKKTNLPVVRIEWRLKSAGIIRRYAGISKIEDVLKFDAQDFFQRNYEMAEINNTEFGKWLSPNSYLPVECKTFTYYPRPAQTYCRYHNIQTSEDLRSHIKKLKEEVARTRGRRNPFQQKVSHLTAYQINKFFNPLDITF